MFLFVNSLNKCLYSEYYDNFSQLRYQTFIEELNWDVPHENGREYDQFDHNEAHYIILIDQNKQVYGGIRLMPTCSPHMLKDVFSNLVNTCEPPLRKSIWEISRLVIKKSPSDTVVDMRYRFQELIQALINFAVLHDIQDYVSVSEIRVERLFRMAGFPMMRLGQVIEMNGVHVVATSMQVTQNVLNVVNAKYFELGGLICNSKLERAGDSILYTQNC